MKKIFIAMLTTSLVACGGGGSDSSSEKAITLPEPEKPITLPEPEKPITLPEPEKPITLPVITEVMPVGLWEGEVVNDGITFQAVAFIAPDGEARILTDDGEHDRMTLVLDGDQFSADLVGFDSNGFLIGSGTISGEYSDTQISSSFDADASGQQLSTLSLTISDQSSESASLSTVTGNYVSESQNISIAIDIDGLISGSDINGCQYAGNISVPEPAVNIYELTFDVSSCDIFNGTYMGLATNVTFFDDSTQKTLIFLVDNGLYAVTFSLIK